ncbi:hypothetical protein AV530_010552 [Patagioenas fasciata monilis]|uniref:Uncharacterized protein n=1 Tax=Patagioenas fasciata monilis TaxID=372326 RepID=A0A1V4KFA5_PATFA|nr:hypothetical protein AV530_010552 [Patagioenas fasciata monilis]
MAAGAGLSRNDLFDIQAIEKITRYCIPFAEGLWLHTLMFIIQLLHLKSCAFLPSVNSDRYQFSIILAAKSR